MIPPSGSKNDKGEYIDVLENLRTKKKIAKLMIPYIWDMIHEDIKLGKMDESDSDTVLAKKVCKQIAECFNIDLDES